MIAAAKLYFRLLFVVFVITVFLSNGAHAQKKKTTAERKKPQTTNQQIASKTANSKSNDKKSAKQSAEKQTASKTDKNSKDKTATTAKSRQAELKNRAEEKRQAEIRQAEDARRREIEDARRQAALAEKRRREEIARAARERAVAFERGLRTETVQNIANDDTEGEDLEVRSAAITALGNKAGMVVVMEPQTGKILSIVNQDWAVRKAYKPCSTIKLVTAIAGLNENVIDASDGSITTRRFPMDLNDALAFSNNKYFQTVGLNLGNKKMLAYAQMLGLGRPTGLNTEGETSGRLPFGNSNAKVYSHGEDFEVSPVQLAVLVSTISNGGKIVVPQIPHTKFEQTNFRMTTRGTVNLPLNDLQGVVPGMIGAASYGTARHGVNASLGIAGKTGSCIGQGSWLGLFTSVAPVANPKLAVVVITRGQAERGKYAAAVAGKIYQALSYRLREKGSPNFVAQSPTVPKPLTIKPQPKIDAKTAALLDEDDEEGNPEEAEVDNDALLSKGKKGAAENYDKPEAAQRTEKRAAKPPTANTTFAPVVITVKREKPEATRPRVVSHK